MDSLLFYLTLTIYVSWYDMVKRISRICQTRWRLGGGAVEVDPINCYLRSTDVTAKAIGCKVRVFKRLFTFHSFQRKFLQLLHKNIFLMSSNPWLQQTKNTL